MKIRIKGNTIRLRLTKSEVEYFGNTNYLEEQTSFINDSFKYSLRASDVVDVTASLEKNHIRVEIPFAVAKKWTSTNQVGCNGETEIGDGKKLFILIEKDFKCLDDTTEDQSDNYENPLAGKK